jgi:hypothetical protein
MVEREREDPARERAGGVKVAWVTRVAGKMTGSRWAAASLKAVMGALSGRWAQPVRVSAGSGTGIELPRSRSGGMESHGMASNARVDDRRGYQGCLPRSPL